MHPQKLMDSIKSTEDIGFMFSLDKVKMMTMNNIRDILKEAQVGETAPNPELIDLETRTKLPLVSLAKAGRPLVLNFGSWPTLISLVRCARTFLRWPTLSLSISPRPIQ